MTFSCPLCREEWLILTWKGLCPSCDRIRFIMSCYSREKVLEVLEKVFLIDKFLEDDEKKADEYVKNSEGKWIKPQEID